MALFTKRSVSVWLILGLFLLLPLVFPSSRHAVRDTAISFYHSNPWSHDRQVDSYDFVSSAKEDACLSGHTETSGAFKKPIPKLVHFITGIRPDLRDVNLSFLAYTAIRAALVSIKPEKLKLHHSHLNQDASNTYLQRLLDRYSYCIQLIHHDEDELRAEAPQSMHFEHITDVLRLRILREEGGTYLDTDVFALSSFDRLLHSPYDVVMGHEGGDRSGLCNAAIVARPGAAFLEHWIESYADFRATEWNQHSVIVPKKLSGRYPDEICTLAPTAFFWPTWTWEHLRWMHEDLSAEDATKTKRVLDHYRGALVEGQLAYHAWGSLARQEFELRELTEEAVMTKDTRFNLMLRRFLDVDGSSD